MTARRAIYDVALGVAALCVVPAIVIMFAPDTRAEPSPTADTIPSSATTVATTTPPRSSSLTIGVPAVAAAAAARDTEPPTTPSATTTTAVPVFRCADVVNSIVYTWGDVEPARLAYRETARCMGWAADTIALWEPFIVDDVIRGESGGCPNLRRGARLANPEGCVIARQGRYEDSGFSQLIGVWWRGAGTPVCDRLGLCTSNAIIASPWNSMAATLVAVEWDGSRPWCWSARARRLHQACATTPRRWTP